MNTKSATQIVDIHGHSIEVEAHDDGTVHLRTHYFTEDSRGRPVEAGSDTIAVTVDQAITLALRLIGSADTARRLVAESEPPF